MQMNPGSPARQTRVIELTNRRPVKIFEDEWPVIASGVITDPVPVIIGLNYIRLQSLYVRQNADGRALVYYTIDNATERTRQRSGGTLMPSGGNLEETIRTVGIDSMAGAALNHDLLAAQCFAKLPAEDLTVPTPSSELPHVRRAVSQLLDDIDYYASCPRDTRSKDRCEDLLNNAQIAIKKLIA
jgi:hypothetical protein